MPGEPKITGKLLACSVLFAFLLFTFNLALTDSKAQTGTFQVSVAGTAAGSIPHQIDLKITQLPGGQLSQVNGFVVGPEDVLQVKQGENILVSTSPDLQVHKVTVLNVQGTPIDLAPLPNNVWSLQGLLPGVYTLDIIANMPSSGILGTYETMLVILEPNQQPLPPTTVISQITVEESAVCPPNLILVNGNCTDPKPPPPTPITSPAPRPTDDCNDPSTPRTMCPPSLWGEEDVEETNTEDADEDISPEFSGDEDDTPVPDEPEEDEVSNPDDDSEESEKESP